jgi:hypothetical protein
MKSERRERNHLLRWYPAKWRDRYGEEFVALVHDEFGDATPSLRYRAAVACAGLRERVLATGLVGRHIDATTRLRSGSLLVLSTWTLFVLGGISLQKTSEHFARAVPLGSRASSQDAFNTVVFFAVISAVAVGVGTVATFPAVSRFIRSGGWLRVRGHVLRSAIASAFTVLSLAPLSWWAHHLNELQRNGGDGLYSCAITAWALLVAFTLASWTTAAIAMVKRVGLSNTVLKFEGVLAIVVTACMAAVTFATAWWWNELATHASWFFQGSPAGSRSSAISPNMVVTVSIMVFAALCASLGVARIIVAWRESPPRS